MFYSPLENDISIDSYSTNPVIGSDKRVITFTSKDYNKDLSGVQQFSFTFSMESTSTNLLTDQVDFTGENHLTIERPKDKQTSTRPCLEIIGHRQTVV